MKETIIENHLTNISRPERHEGCTNTVIFGAYHEIKKLRLKIPDDIALAGFSNNPTGALLDPPLTTLNQPAYDIGKVAAELLLDRIINNKTKIINKILPTKLIIRKTT